MRKIIFIFIALLTTLSIKAQEVLMNKEWTFNTLSNSDLSLIKADSKWNKDERGRYFYTDGINYAPLKANGEELKIASGLKFFTRASKKGKNGNISIARKAEALWLGAKCKIIVPNRKKNDVVTVTYVTSNQKAERTLRLDNAVGTFPPSKGKEAQTAMATVIADGDVTMTIEGGMYIQYISVQDGQTAAEKLRY